MHTGQSSRRWFGLGLLIFGLLLLPAGSGRALAETKLKPVGVPVLIDLREPQPYPTVYHYLFDKGQGWLREQQRHLRRIPRTVRKIFLSQTREDLRAEEQEQLSITLSRLVQAQIMQQRQLVTIHLREAEMKSRLEREQRPPGDANEPVKPEEPRPPAKNIAPKELKIIRVFADGSVRVKDLSKKYPTVYHYLFDKGKGWLREQQRHARRIPRTVRKLLLVQTREDLQEEQLERAQFFLEMELEDLNLFQQQAITTIRVPQAEMKARPDQEEKSPKKGEELRKPAQPNPMQ